MSRRTRLDRRRFLQSAAAAAGIVGAVPTIVTPRAVRAGQEPAANDRVTVGMIGLGRQAYLKNMRQFLSMPDVQIVAVCDVDSWRLGNAKQAIEQHYARRTPASAYRGCQVYQDYQDLLGRQDIDAVMISTPDHWHAPMTLAAFAAKKDVSLEKPITRTIAEGQAIRQEAVRLGRVFRVDSEFRSVAGVHRAAELVRNGRIGKVHTVTVGVPGTDVPCPPQAEMPVPKELDYERWQGPAPRAPYTEFRVHPPASYERPGWMRHLYYCDGMITNWGAHLNDGAMWCTDLERTGPVEIEGTGTYPPADSFWNVLLSFEVHYRFASGIRWTYRTDKPYFKVEGSEGWVWADFNTIEAEPASLLQEQLGPNELRFPLKSDKQDFIDSVKSRQETLEPPEVGQRVTTLCHLGHLAIWLGEKLTWDPGQERFVGNDAANALLDKPIQTPRGTAQWSGR